MTPIITVDNLYKEFMLPHSKNNSLKQAVINRVTGNSDKEVQQVLHGISFQVEQGEFLGIVGRNGSGKSTLLKTMAGVYTPTKGGVHKHGSLVPFIELGVGFNPDLSGRDNVFLNGSLLGFSRKEMMEMYKDIVEFSELERFMDQKLKNYSSGMQVRLAFSIAIRARGDILLLDEVLAVGDSEFQKKCHDYFAGVKDSGQTVILVTHSMDLVERYCDRAILLEDGLIHADGDPGEVVAKYELRNLSSQKASDTPGSEYADDTSGAISSVTVDTQTDAVVEPDQAITIAVDFRSPQDTGVRAGLSIVRDDGVKVAMFGTGTDDYVECRKDTDYTIGFDIAPGQLNKGFYKIDAAIFTRDGDTIARGVNLARFRVNRNEKGKDGLVNLDFQWDMAKKSPQSA